jgi:hypothetical protein
MTQRHCAAGALLVGALVASGCGTKCPTEPPAELAVGSCTAKPGDTVNVLLRLCPTCNQTGAACDVDLSGVSSGFIGLNATVEACESSTSCSSPGAACQANPLTCTFTAPGEGDYQLVVSDSSGPLNGTLTVRSNLASSCEFPAAALTSQP